MSSCQMCLYEARLRKGMHVSASLILLKYLFSDAFVFLCAEACGVILFFSDTIHFVEISLKCFQLLMYKC